jgi:ATPase family AAA domain-containing protein 3A/B
MRGMAFDRPIAHAIRSNASTMLARLAAGGVGLALGVVAPSLALADGAPKEVDAKSMQRLFDPEALERGAAALKEINKSPHAKNVRSVGDLLRRRSTCACRRRVAL